MLNILKTLFVEFYCLPVQKILALLVISAYAYLLLNRRCHSPWKVIRFLALVLWVVIITFATVSGRESSVHNTLSLIPFHSYREILNGGNPEILRSNFMNAVLFFPAGLMGYSVLPEKWSKPARIISVFLFFTLLSSGIEFLQYNYGIGRAEIDDVIHNGIGALVGGLCALIPLSDKPNG